MQPDSFAPGTLFTRIFQDSPVAMTVTTLDDDRYVDVNSAFANLVGIERENLIGRSNAEFYPAFPLNDDVLDTNDVGTGPTTKGISRLRTARGDARCIVASTQIEEWNGTPYLITLAHDLTDYHRMQKLLRLSEARFRLFFDNMPLPVFAFDIETMHIVDANPAAAKLYGYSREELLSMTMLDIRSPEERSRFIERLNSLPDDTSPVGIWKHRKKDGTLINVEITSYGVIHDGRHIRLSVMQDVTEQLTMVAALRESEERLRIIAELTTDVIGDFNLTAQTFDYTYGTRSLFGYELQDMDSPQWWIDHIHPEERAVVAENFGRVLQGAGNFWTTQFRFLRADGRYAHLLIRSYIVRDEAGRPLRIIGALVDITRQVDLKEAATHAAMEERRRLARDLHDAVTQSLYSLSLMAEAARRRARLGDQKETSEHISRLGELAQQALKEMHLLVYELRPSALEKDGFIGALQARLDAVERHSGVRARMQVDLQHELSPEIQLQFYRIAEEALNNSLKHASASAVRIAIRSTENSAVLEITDNGKGFDPAVAATSGGLGLTSMAERLEHLGGRFKLDTAPGKGTKIRVILNTAEGNHGKQDSHSHL